MAIYQDDGWEDDQEAPGYSIADSGAIRVALLFGSAAVAIALIVAPLVDLGAGSVVASRGISAELDRTSTGSINRSGTYTLRRSVLQQSPSSVCIINKGGQQIGEC